MVGNYINLKTANEFPHASIVRNGEEIKFPFPESDDHELYAVIKNIYRMDFELDKYKNVLELGSNGSFMSNMLSQAGHNVVGIDVNDYHCYPDGMERDEPECEFMFIKGNASEIEFKEYFDLIISISAIEHFGCGYYGDKSNFSADVDAMKSAYNSLKKGGKIVITVPITDKEYSYIDQGYIRRYNQRDIIQRLIGKFDVRYFETIPKLMTMVSSASCMIAPHGHTPIYGFSRDDLYRADFASAVKDYESACIYLELIKE